MSNYIVERVRNGGKSYLASVPADGAPTRFEREREKAVEFSREDAEAFVDSYSYGGLKLIPASAPKNVAGKSGKRKR